MMKTGRLEAFSDGVLPDTRIEKALKIIETDQSAIRTPITFYMTIAKQGSSHIQDKKEHRMSQKQTNLSH